MNTVFKRINKIFNLSGLVESKGKIKYESFSSPFSSRIARDFLETTYDFNIKNAIYRLDHFSGFISIYNDVEKCNYVFGPFLSNTKTNAMQTNYIEKYHISYKNRIAFISFFENLPSIAPAEQPKIFTLLYSYINNSAFPAQNIKIINLNKTQADKIKKIYHTTAVQYDFPENDIVSFQNAQNTYSFLQQIYHYIQDGNPEQLEMLWKKEEISLNNGLFKNTLTNYRTTAISGITLGSHAAITGGLSPEVSFHLLDIYCFLIHETSDLNDILTLTTTCLLEFANRVKLNETSTDVPPVISTCISYINSHLYERITLSDLGIALKINNSYLSKQFSKYMGCSISEYIRTKKIEEARELLCNTDHSLARISEELHFSSQPHFQKIFKQMTGLTPAEYRNKYNIN